MMRRRTVIGTVRRNRTRRRSDDDWWTVIGRGKAPVKTGVPAVTGGKWDIDGPRTNADSRTVAVARTMSRDGFGAEKHDASGYAESKEKDASVHDKSPVKTDASVELKGQTVAPPIIQWQFSHRLRHKTKKT